MTLYRAIAAVFLALCAPAQAALQIPYAPDSSTLHLWHLDESGGYTAADAVAASGITLTNVDLTLGRPPASFDALGTPSFTGLGKAYSGMGAFSQHNHLLFGGYFTNFSQFSSPETGAFTFEAIVSFRDSLSNLVFAIVCGDGPPPNRSWEWRINNGVMEWNLRAGSLSSFKAPLPVTGPNATIPGLWYHVAVTYTGAPPAAGISPNILAFYWTPLDGLRTVANKLAEFTAARPLDGTPALGVGGSAYSTQGIIGSIDEVRISNAARTADQMAFTAAGLLNPAASGLFHTGLDASGALSAGNIPDPHWTLFRSSNPANLGPNALIFENSAPLQLSSATGVFSPANGVSMWVGAAGNRGAAPVISPTGDYIYRARFLLESADPATVRMEGKLWVSGSVSDILVNGKSTGLVLAPGSPLLSTPFSITNGFSPGWNTLDFVETLPSPGISAVRVEIQSAGLSLPPGKPAIIEQPADQTVHQGSGIALFSVAALGSPPLSYQWQANGNPLASATNRTLSFLNPTAGGQGTSFSVLVRNDSGSITSRVARLTLVSTNQPPVPGPVSFVTFAGHSFLLSLSQLVQSAVDPDHDPVEFVSSEFSSTNGRRAGLDNVQRVNSHLVYTPVPGSSGVDQFGYTIMDQTDSAVGSVNCLVLSPPVNQIVPLGSLASFAVGLPPGLSGYSFQWQLNGTNIPGATSPQLAIANAAYSDAGSYRVLITDPFGQVWPSPGAKLMFGTVGVSFGQETILSDCSFAALENAVQKGGNIVLSCNGPIFFQRAITVRTNVSLSGASLTTLSGGNLVRHFIVEENACLRLNNLVIRDGYATAGVNPNTTFDTNAGTHVYGGAIWNRGGMLTLTNCTFAANSVRGGDGGADLSLTPTPGAGGGAFGGAIMSSNGFVQVQACIFRSNSVRGGTGGPATLAGTTGAGGLASGGAIHQIGGNLMIGGASFESNQAVAGVIPVSRYYNLSQARGGALSVEQAEVQVSACLFLTNSVSNGSADGGAIYARSSPSLEIAETDFHGNSVSALTERWAAYGNARARGGALSLTGSVATIRSCFLSGNSAVGGTVNTQPYNAVTTHSYGGALFNDGTLSIEKSSFSANGCTGAAGDSISNVGGANQPGNGYGGAIYNARNLSVENSTFAVNFAVGGIMVPTPPPGWRPRNASLGSGGAIANAGNASLVHCTFASNSGLSFPTNAFSANGLAVPEAGGSIANDGTVNLEKTILAYSSSNNFKGSVVDLRENLSSDSTPAFTMASSRNSTDPLLASFRYYRSRTPTMALRAGSPALNTATPSALFPTDQRGEPRPYGAFADIGAYEVTPAATNNVFEASAESSALVLSLISTPADQYALLSSTNLVTWQSVLTNATDNLGRLQWRIPISTDTGARIFQGRRIQP